MLISTCGISVALAEFKGKLYRNPVHHFRIKFPLGWNVTDGDGQHIIKKAVDRNGASIVIQVNDLSSNFPFKSISELPTSVQNQTCDDIIYKYIEGIKSQFPNTIILNSRHSYIDNYKAVEIKSRHSYRAAGSSIAVLNTSSITIRNNKYYIVGIGAEEKIYPSLEILMLSSVRTFVFE
jgi:hypothetical protein